MLSFVRRIWIPLALSLVAAAPARAEDDEWALSLGPSFRGLFEATSPEDDAFRPGLGALVRLRYGIGDFLQVGAALDVGLTMANDVSDLAPGGSVLLELHYMIDVVTWVPFATVGVGLLVRGQRPDESGTGTSDDGVQADLVVGIGGGLEYRPAREWALGFSGRYELVVTDFQNVDAFSFALIYTLFFE